jgi:hypothetical protein
LLDVDAVNFDLIQIVERTESFKRAAGIVNGDRGVARELAYESAPGPSGSRVSQRLVEGVPATGIIEGFDAKGHDDQPVPGAAIRPRRDITFQAVGTAKRRLLQILGGAACLRRRIEFAAALW